MGDLHLVYPALNLSILDAGIEGLGTNGLGLGLTILSFKFWPSLTLFNPRLPLLWHLDFEKLCWLIGDIIGSMNDM